MILAAGFGSRLAPLTHQVPKPLLPIWGESILHGLLRRLARWGVRDVLVNLHHAPAPLFDLLRDAALAGPLRITCSHEPEILGTGGALQRARWFFDDAPFWLVNGDVVVDAAPAPFLRALRQRRARAVLMMTTHSGPRTVELAPDGTVRDFASARPGTPGTYTFCGLQIVDPRVLDHVPVSPFSTLVDVYRRVQAAGGLVIGLAPTRAFWMDIGTPEGLLQAHADTLAARGTRAPGGDFARTAPAGDASAFRALAPDVRVARGAVLHNVVALPGVRIGPRARLQNVILGPGVVANGPLERLAVRLDQSGDVSALEAVQALGWPVRDTVLQPLPPRGSNRTYTRLSAGSRTAILVRYSAERPENARFVGHARFLAAQGITVPRILYELPEQRLFIMEDLGRCDLLQAVTNADAATRRRLYAPVVRAVADWHRRTGPAVRRASLALEPGFTPRLFAWEHALFRDHYLRGRLGLDPAGFAEALAELRRVAARLARTPRTVVHRDLQSSNVLLTPGGPAFIDFQGMRVGPALYDVASLLADPYVMLDLDAQRVLLAAYRRQAPLGWRPGRASPEADFWLAAVQRLVQALGAYGRLSRLPGMAGFARHIRPAIDMLDRALQHGYTWPHLHALTRRMRALEEDRS